MEYVALKMKSKLNLKLILLNEKTFQEYAKQIRVFKSKINSNLAKYLKKKALQSFCENKSMTYLVIDTVTEEIVAYFSLSAFSFMSTIGIYKLQIPAVLLENFATNSLYIQKINNTRKMGIVVFDEFIIPLVKSIQKELGIYGIALFAADKLDGKLVAHYQNNYGFSIVDVNGFDIQYPSYDDGCVFMFCRI